MKERACAEERSYSKYNVDIQEIPQISSSSYSLGLASDDFVQPNAPVTDRTLCSARVRAHVPFMLLRSRCPVSLLWFANSNFFFFFLPWTIRKCELQLNLSINYSQHRMLVFRKLIRSIRLGKGIPWTAVSHDCAQCWALLKVLSSKGNKDHTQQRNLNQEEDLGGRRGSASQSSRFPGLMSWADFPGCLQSLKCMCF